MIEYQNFDDLFHFSTQYSYDSSHTEMIEAHRKSLEGLFVDKVLKALDVKRRKFTEARRMHYCLSSPYE
jgi:hypothetical protein